MLRLSSTSCFKYFVIIKFSKFCKKDKCSCGRWPTHRLLYLNIKQGNYIKGNLSTNFLFQKFFSDTSSFKSIHWSCSIKKMVLKIFGIFIGKHLCWSLFLIKLQAFRTIARLIFLHALFKFDFSLGKTLKNFINFL